MTPALVALLIGPVGVGKTTVAAQVATLAQQQGYRVGGLLAPALLNSEGEKVGIQGAALRSGEQRTLARIGTALEGPQVGLYAFDGGTLAWANRALARDASWADLLIVDEIGKLELWQGEGLAPILPQPGQLASGLAAAQRALVLVREALVAELCARLAGLALLSFEVTVGNRDHLAPRIVDRLFAQSGPAARR